MSIYKLENLAQTVQREHDAGSEAAATAVDHFIAAGEALNEAKKLLNRGEWTPWMLENFPDISITTLNTYMRVARFKHEIIEAAPPDLKSAGRIARDSRIQIRRVSWDKVDRQAIKDLHQNGRTIRQICEILEVPYNQVHTTVHPEQEKVRRAKASSRTKAGRRALARQERDAEVKKHGGDLSLAYSHVRKALQLLEGVELKSSLAKRSISDAMHKLYFAEDKIGQAVKNEAVA